MDHCGVVVEYRVICGIRRDGIYEEMCLWHGTVDGEIQRQLQVGSGDHLCMTI